MTYAGKNATIGQCTVQSIYGYFGNSMQKFNRTDVDAEGNELNYLNVLIKCFTYEWKWPACCEFYSWYIRCNFRNPYDLYCLAPYGGPVEPGIALGGYPKAKPGQKPDYRLATGIVLTFLINNYQNDSLVKPAMEWELKYLFAICYRFFGFRCINTHKIFFLQIYQFSEKLFIRFHRHCILVREIYSGCHRRTITNGSINGHSQLHSDVPVRSDCTGKVYFVSDCIGTLPPQFM